jgi:hypothetical protein
MSSDVGILLRIAYYDGFFSAHKKFVIPSASFWREESAFSQL